MRSPRVEHAPDAPANADRGVIGVMLCMLVIVCLAGAGLVVDGGRALIARRHASNTAEAAARAGVATGSPLTGLDPRAAQAAAVSYAVRSGVPSTDVSVVVDAGTVAVTIVERRATVFLILGGQSTITVRAIGTARFEYSR